MTYAELAQQVRERQEACRLIADKLGTLGYDVDWQRVNRNFPVFYRWYTGNLAMGYLRRQTGIHPVSSRG